MFGGCGDGTDGNGSSTKGTIAQCGDMVIMMLLNEWRGRPSGEGRPDDCGREATEKAGEGQTHEVNILTRKFAKINIELLGDRLHRSRWVQSTTMGVVR